MRRRPEPPRGATFAALRQTYPHTRWARDAAAVPAVPGAYVLVVRLAAPLAVHFGRRVAGTLAPGRYCYCGSARGPGGLKARLARHFRADKTVRWHIDQLTLAGTVEAALVVPDGDECALSATLRLPIALAGFGASDCTRCSSHLFALPADT